MSNGDVALFGERALLSPPTMSIGGASSRTSFPFNTHMQWQHEDNDVAMMARCGL